MPNFSKSRGFKLKSGNTVSFKEMGSSPVKQGQADATLVAAARHAAMANVPKDLSAQYDKTAEGVIAAQKGKMEMMKTAAKELPGIAIAAGRAIQKGTAKRKARKADPEFQAAKTKIKETRATAKEDRKVEGADKKAIREQKRADLKIQKAEKKLHKQRVDEAFEKEYKEEHKDRKSIADIRAITGADQVGKEEPNYKNLLAKLKYEEKVKGKKKKANGNGSGSGNEGVDDGASSQTLTRSNISINPKKSDF